MTQYGYAILGLTTFIGVLVAIVVFALLRFMSAARDVRRPKGNRSETALLSAALHDAVAKLKAQEQAMSARARASEQLSGQIVESLTAGLLMVARDGRIAMLNPAGRRMLGLYDAAVGDHYRTVLAGIPPLVETLAECLDLAMPIVRRTISVPGPRPLHLGLSVSPLGGTAGDGLPSGDVASDSTRGIICLFSDLTTVRELEEQLRLKETLATLGELTAGIAHEFRNGLATIHGYSRLIDPQVLPERHRPYVHAIRKETELLGKVVTNFLNFARPEKASFGRVNLGSVAGRTVDDLRHELSTPLSLVVEGSFGDITGDEVLLRQVFDNLIRNAVEACEAAAILPVVTIVGSIDAKQRICRVTVTDNGPGIPDESRRRIFQPFFTTRLRGTGLGLAIVQKVAVMHNGRVAVQENPGGGARILLVFPLADSSTSATGSEVSGARV